MYTRVVDVETGEALTNVKRLEITIESEDKFATAVVTSLRLTDDGQLVILNGEVVEDVWEATIVEVSAA